MRPDIHTYFMQIADLVKERSTCIRRKVGCVIVKDKNIIATGYNGAPAKCAHCDKDSCLRSKLNIPSGERHELCRGTHAEQNAIAQAAKNGTSVNGADIYINLPPCSICSKILINSGIKRVYYQGNYSEKLGLELLKEADVEVIHMN